MAESDKDNLTFKKGDRVKVKPGVTIKDGEVVIPPEKINGRTITDFWTIGYHTTVKLDGVSPYVDVQALELYQE